LHSRLREPVLGRDIKSKSGRIFAQKCLMLN
jgi:hypothetical protein